MKDSEPKKHNNNKKKKRRKKKQNKKNKKQKVSSCRWVLFTEFLHLPLNCNLCLSELFFVADRRGPWECYSKKEAEEAEIVNHAFSCHSHVW